MNRCHGYVIGYVIVSPSLSFPALSLSHTPSPCLSHTLSLYIAHPLPFLSLSTRVLAHANFTTTATRMQPNYNRTATRVAHDCNIILQQDSRTFFSLLSLIVQRPSGRCRKCRSAANVTRLQQDCNKTATRLQHDCNKTATRLQKDSNKTATR